MSNQDLHGTLLDPKQPHDSDGYASELEHRATANDIDPDFDEYWSDFYDPRREGDRDE